MWTRIVATLGPASNSPETIRDLIESGVDIFRLNFSHGTLPEHHATLQAVRRAAEEADRPIAVIGDLCGPKIRIGKVADGKAILKTGDRLALQSAPVLGTSERLSVSLPTLCRDVQPEAAILIDDGAILLHVLERTDDQLICEVRVGGTVSSHKGVNLPGTDIAAPSLTEKDLADADWAIEHQLDFLALSFVRSPDDVRALRRVLQRAKSSARIIAKIEKPQAIDHLDEIIETSDAILVARGDLGVEMDITRVSLLQKEITLRCRRAARPVIVATQMLQSMIDAPTPTRAEASDVANAVFDSVDAVMLSGETAIGRYPVRAAQIMNDIVRETEKYRRTHPQPKIELELAPRQGSPVTSSVVTGAALVAEQLDARCVVVWTEKGVSAQLLSRQRMHRTIVAVTQEPALCRQLSLCYGVTAFVRERPAGSDLLPVISESLLLERKLADPGDLILVLAAAKALRPGSTGAIYIHRILSDSD